MKWLILSVVINFNAADSKKSIDPNIMDFYIRTNEIERVVTTYSKPIKNSHFDERLKVCEILTTKKHYEYVQGSCEDLVDNINKTINEGCKE